MPTEATHELALLMQYEDGRRLSWSNNYCHYNGKVVMVPRGTEDYFQTYDVVSKYDYDKLGLPFGATECYEGLRIVSQGSLDSDGTIKNEGQGIHGMYAIGVEYRQLDGLKLFELEARVKLLKQFEKKMEKLEQQDGRWQSFGQYVLRVSKSLGIKRIMFELTPEQQQRCGYRYKTLNAVDGMYRIDRTILEKSQPKETA